MATTSTPQAFSRHSTPNSRLTPTPASLSGPSTPPPTSNSGSTGTGTTTSTSSKSTHKPKPINVFTDDGSFLERFQRIEKEGAEKKKHEIELEKKRNFESRFKNRGKRRAPSSEDPIEVSDDSPAKKSKLDSDKPLTAYEKEVKSYTGSLKDNGTGIRPLVK